MPITLEEWIADPEGVVDRVFAADGPFSRHMPGYRLNRHQIRYAKLLARAAARGADPETVGRVSAVEGGTGLGKSVAILVVVGINALLRGKRGLVTTYTRFLNRQMSGRDGTTAAAVVEEVVGRPLSIAVRRPRSAFASPTLCLHQALVIENEIAQNGLDANAVESRHLQIDVLRRLSEWTIEQSITILDNEGRLLPIDETASYVAEFGGLIETFLAENDDAKIPLQEIPFDLYTLNGVSGEGEQRSYEAYARASLGADILIATHAALVRDMSFSGRLLDTDGRGFSMIVCDEANRLEDAGVLALGTKRALSSFRRDAEIVLPFVGKLPEVDRLEVARLLLEQNADGEHMLALIETVRADAPNFRTDIVVAGGEPWFAMLDVLQERTTRIIRILRLSDVGDVLAIANRLSHRHRDIEVFADCVRRHAAAGLAPRGAPLARQDRSFSIPLLTFSPHAAEPSVHAKPKKGARILSRLWLADVPRADAVFLTSATIGMPARAGGAPFNTILETVGLEPNSPRINVDLIQSIEMTNFGSILALMLAGPRVPLPSRPVGARAGRNDHRNPDWLAFAGGRIGEAYADVWRTDGRNRVVVLCTGFDEIEALADHCEGLVGPGDLHIRTRAEGVDTGFDWLQKRGRGVLVTTGAFDGIDRPALIDHLVVPRLPYPIRPDAFYREFTDRSGELRFSRRVEEMMMMLKQAFGRPLRKATDETKIWVLDPRIGLPRGAPMPAHPLSDPRHLNAVPSRFADVVAAAIILGPAPGEVE